MSPKSKQKKDKQIIEEDNRCYICNNLATTIDHLPPKSFFFHRHTPQEFIFSCCEECNQNSKKEDQIASVILTLPEIINFQSMSFIEKQHYDEKLKRAIRNSKRPFFKENGIYVKSGFFYRNGIISKINDGRSFKYRDYISSIGAKEISITEYGFLAVNKISIKLTYAIFKNMKNKIGEKTIGPQFKGRVFSKIDYLDCDESYLSTIFSMCPNIAKINHRQKSDTNFGFRYKYSDDNGVLIFSSYFGGQFILNCIAFSDKFLEFLYKQTENPFLDGFPENIGFKEINKDILSE